MPPRRPAIAVSGLITESMGAAITGMSAIGVDLPADVDVLRGPRVRRAGTALCRPSV